MLETNYDVAVIGGGHWRFDMRLFDYLKSGCTICLSSDIIGSINS